MSTKLVSTRKKSATVAHAMNRDCQASVTGYRGLVPGDIYYLAYREKKRT